MQLQRLLTTEKFVSHKHFQCETNRLARFAFLQFSRTLKIQDSNHDFGVLMLAHNLGKKPHFVLEIPAHDKILPPLKMFSPKCRLLALFLWLAANPTAVTRVDILTVIKYNREHDIAMSIPMKISLFYVYFFSFFAAGICWCAEISPEYRFDSSGISRVVLENYLKHSITMTELLADSALTSDETFSGREDDLRLLRNIGAKFIGRAFYRWGREDVLNNPALLAEAKKTVTKLHETDPDIVFQACLFEIVTPSVNNIKIPDWAFKVLGLPAEDRNFRYNDMLNVDGKFVNHWGRSSVPDISRTEPQLWFIFLAGFYMEAGCEAFHLGQVNLMDMNDPGLQNWAKVVGHMRELAKTKTRRGWIILDAHTPRGGMIVDGKSLLDFNSFPLRVKEIVDKPMEGILEVGYLDSLYKKSKGCITPSSWQCDSLPYLVEFDNFGVSRTPGESTVNAHFIWGYDEITWFWLQDEEYRNSWLKYAYNWLRETDPNGFLQMPVGRVVSPGGGQRRDRFRANPPSEAIPNGKNLEATIKELWK